MRRRRILSYRICSTKSVFLYGWVQRKQDAIFVCGPFHLESLVLARLFTKTVLQVRHLTLETLRIDASSFQCSTYYRIVRSIAFLTLNLRQRLVQLGFGRRERGLVDLFCSGHRAAGPLFQNSLLNVVGDSTPKTNANSCCQHLTRTYSHHFQRVLLDEKCCSARCSFEDCPRREACQREGEKF